MPRNYERKTLRASWAAKDLEEAMQKVRNKELGTNEAAKTYGIPSRTLRRHLISGKSKGPLGRKPVFCKAYEKKLVTHIKKLEMVGFAPQRKDVKQIAYQLAQNLKINNPFNEHSETAGNVWFNGFMSRNPELSQRKSEGLSLARAYGVNRQDVKNFFDLLEKIYQENDFANHPEDIFNMDESGIQVNNKPGKVVATKGVKDVYTLTSCEKGENVTVIACCNAQGNFLPPVLIDKGTYSKPQFSEGLPPGSQVFMNKKSSYINSDLFMKWFEEVFLRHKSPRKTLLIFDGHSSHSNNIRLLEVAKENDVILLCLPSHTTHALQPLDRAFFRPLKVYFSQEAKAWMVSNKDKKLTRYNVSKLIGKAWGKAATISNGISALKSCGIYPFDPNAIPDHYFAMSDSLIAQNLVEKSQTEDDRTPSPSVLEFEDQCESILNEFSSTYTRNNTEPGSSTLSLETDRELVFERIAEPVPLPSRLSTAAQPKPGPSGLSTAAQPMPGPSGISSAAQSKTRPSELNITDQSTQNLSRPNTSKIIVVKPTQETPKKIDGLSYPTKPQETPTKVLAEIYPVPKLPAILCKNKQKAVILTSPENIQKRKLIHDKKKPKNQAEKIKLAQSATTEKTTQKAKKSVINPKRKKCNKTIIESEHTGNKIKMKKEEIKKSRQGSKRNKKKNVITSSSSESDIDENSKICMSEEELSDDTNRCIECTENYYQTQSNEDWIQCGTCLGWLHESCTMYMPKCNVCGRKAKRESIIKNT